jgi:hypothetical protein
LSARNKQTEFFHTESETDVEDEIINRAGMTATMLRVQGRFFCECLHSTAIPEGGLVRLPVQTAAQLVCFTKGAMLMGNKAIADLFEE